MSLLRFQVSTNRTGIHRVIRVLLFDTLEDLRAHMDGLADDGTRAMFVSRWPWEDRDPRPWQGTLMFARDSVTASEVAHEATHAAAHLYSIDSYRDHARASAHLHGANEPLAYLVSDLFGRVARRLMSEGISLDVGRPEFYGSPDAPPYLRT